MKERRICPSCQKDKLITKTMVSSVEVNGQEHPVAGIEFSECQNCGVQPMFAEQSRRNDKKFADVRRSAGGLLTSSEIAGVRVKYGLTQQLCSQLFGGGANSFNKYESGTVIQSTAMDLLVRLVRDVPGTLDYIANLRGVSGVIEKHQISPTLISTSIYSCFQPALPDAWMDVKKDHDSIYMAEKRLKGDSTFSEIRCIPC